MHNPRNTQRSRVRNVRNRILLIACYSEKLYIGISYIDPTMAQSPIPGCHPACLKDRLLHNIGISNTIAGNVIPDRIQIAQGCRSKLEAAQADRRAAHSAFISLIRRRTSVSSSHPSLSASAIVSSSFALNSSTVTSFHPGSRSRSSSTAARTYSSALAYRPAATSASITAATSGLSPISRPTHYHPTPAKHPPTLDTPPIIDTGGNTRKPRTTCAVGPSKSASKSSE
jgi:hypothetical protein